MFCFMNTRINYPASVSTLASWLASLGDKTVKAKTIKHTSPAYGHITLILVTLVPRLRRFIILHYSES